MPVKINGSTSGSVTLSAPATGSDVTVTLPGSTMDLGSELAAKLTTPGAWTAYTPTIGGTGWALGNGVISGRYALVGSVVTFTCQLSFGTTTTAGSSPLSLTLPVTPTALGTSILQVRYYDLSPGNLYVGATAASSTATVNPYVLGTAGVVSYVTTSNPFTFASGDIIHMSGTYEAA